MAEPAARFAIRHGLRLVRLRVSPSAADHAASCLDIGTQPLTWSLGDPEALWVGPGQWLLVARARAPEDVLHWIDAQLAGVLHHACDVSSAFSCVTLDGHAVRTVLATMSGIDYHATAFGTDSCRPTRLAGLPVVVRSLSVQSFELFVDSNVVGSLIAHLRYAVRDPLCGT